MKPPKKWNMYTLVSEVPLYNNFDIDVISEKYNYTFQKNYTAT